MISACAGASAIPAFERATECAELRIAEHKRDGRQIVMGTLYVAHRYGLPHGQYELIIRHVAFLQLLAKPMHRQAQAAGHGADGRITPLALALDYMREQTQPTVPVCVQDSSTVGEVAAD